MPIVKIVFAMLLASTLMILPASDSHAASLQSVGCAASSGGSQVCPSYDVLYAHDPVFKGAFLKAISAAKITKPSWFPNGVTGGVSAVKIAGRMVLFSNVCEPHNCSHQLNVFYDPQNSRVSGFYYTNPNLGQQRSIGFGDPTQAELEYIQGSESDRLGQPSTQSTGTKPALSINTSASNQQNQLAACQQSNGYRILRVEYDILENQKLIRLYQSAIQREEDGAKYSGFVDKEKMYNAGQAIAQLKQKNAFNFSTYRSLGGSATVAEAVVFTPDPCASLSKAAKEEQARQTKIAQDAAAQRTIDEQAKKYQDKQNHIKKMEDLQTRYPQANLGSNPCNLNRSSDPGDIQKSATFLVAINEVGEITDADLEKTSGISYEDDQKRVELMRCKVPPAVTNGKASLSWSHVTVVWYVLDSSHSLYH